VWGGVLEVFEVVRGREREIGHGRRFLPPNNNTEHNVLDIGGALVKLAERVLIMCGMVWVMRLRWCGRENTGTNAAGGFHPQMPIPSATRSISAGGW
jgi:hypothetical protein